MTRSRTSVWLWLYAASVLVSRVLLRMNNGVGFLLRVTDVERQPFRSMGFVSVIIVSVLFALGLPVVLLLTYAIHLWEPHLVHLDLNSLILQASISF